MNFDSPSQRGKFVSDGTTAMRACRSLFYGLLCILYPCPTSPHRLSDRTLSLFLNMVFAIIELTSDYPPHDVPAHIASPIYFKVILVVLECTIAHPLPRIIAHKIRVVP